MKKSMFLNVIKGNKEYLLHNTLYGTMVKAKCDITMSIVDNIENNTTFEYEDNNEFHKALKNLKMLVDENLNEVSLVNYHFSEMNKEQISVILIVTRQCDFRCVYCYEKHENKKMNKNVYENLLNALKSKVKSKKYKSIEVSFFGGEPLLEYQSICDFMEKLNVFVKEEDIKIHGSITTNGYSLSLNRLKKLVDLNVTYYQITIDGIEETHNNNRYLVNGNGTWNKIIQNLKDAKNSDLSFIITLRTNFDINVADQLRDYVDFLSNNLANDNRFNVHFEAVKKLGGELDNQLNIQTNEHEAVDSMFALAEKLNLNTSKYFLSCFGKVCYAAKNNSFVLDTDGTLLKCTVVIDSPKNIVGKLTDKGFEIEDVKISNWTSYVLPNECYNCKILALCFGRKCPISVWDSTIWNLDDCKNHVSIYESSLCHLYKIN